MNDVIISSIITGVISLVICLINNNTQQAKTRTLLEYKLEQLTTRVNKHNSVIDRTYELEKKMDVNEEKISVLNHRVGDLEKGNN